MSLELASGRPRGAAGPAPAPPGPSSTVGVPAFVPPTGGVAVLDDGTVVTAVGSEVVGVRAGEVRWRVDVGAAPSLVGAGARVVVAGASTRAIDADGRTRWEDDLGDRQEVLAVAGGTVLSRVAGPSATVAASALATGARRGRWASPGPGTVEAAHLDGRWATVLVRRADLTTELVGLERTGDGLVRRWEAPAPAVTDLVGRGGVVVAAGRSWVTVVDPRTGPVREVELPTLATPGRFALGDGVVIWVAGSELVVTGLDDGAERGRVAFPAVPSAAPTVADELVLVATADGGLQRVRLGRAAPAPLPPVDLGALPAAAPVAVGPAALAVRTRAGVILLGDDR